MTPSRKRFLVLAIVVVPFVLLIGARQVGPAKDIPSGTGYAALELCTRTMLSANIAMLRMRQVMGSHQAIYDYYQSRLFAPLGIRNGVIEPDASGTPVGGARGILRPVDWLRLGQLVANGGMWSGTRLLSEDYVKFLMAPSPASAEYGASIWRQPSKRVAAEIRARLPQDSVWFAGHMEQFTIVVPSRNFVLVRMGVSFDHDTARNHAFALAAEWLDAQPAAAPVQ